MHALALQLTPVLAAEKSKVAFYVAGGVLVVWALTLSLGIGLRRPDFPSSVQGQRAIMGVSVVLMLAAVSTAVITSGVPAKGNVPPAKTQELAPVPDVSAPALSSSSSSSAGQSTSTGAASSLSSKPSSSLKLAANPSGALAYNTKHLSAKAGTVTITMANMSPEGHNVTIAQGSKVLGATPTFDGGSKTLKLKLKPGKYTFYCSVPGHRQAGMEGTLTVS